MLIASRKKNCIYSYISTAVINNITIIIIIYYYYYIRKRMPGTLNKHKHTSLVCVYYKYVYVIADTNDAHMAHSANVSLSFNTFLMCVSVFV